MNDMMIDSRKTTVPPTLPSERAVGTTLLDGVLPTPAMLKTSLKPSAEELQNVANYVSKNAEAEDSEIDTARPQLTKPTGAAAEKIANGEADVSLYSLIGQLEEIFGNDSVEDVKARLVAYKEFTEARKLNIEETSKAFKEAQKALDEAVINLDKATTKLGQASEDLDAQKNIVDAAQAAFDRATQKVEKAQQALDADPTNPEAQQALEEAKQYQQQAQQKLGQTQEKMAVVQRTYDIASAAAGDALDATNAALETLTQRAAELDNEALVPIFNPIKDGKTAVQVMYELMLVLQDVISKDNQNALQNRIEMFKKRQEMLQKQLDQDAKAYAEAQERAKKNSWIANIVAKVLGWVLVAIGVVTSAVTGGVGGFAIAAAGFAVMAIDEVLAALEITTITESIMGPIMEKVIMPFIQVIAEAIMKQMEADGIDPKTAAIVANVIAAITVVAVFVVAAVAGSAAIGSDLVKNLAKGMADKLAKISPQTGQYVTKAMDYMSNAMSSMSTGVVEALEKRLGGPAGLRMMLRIMEWLQAGLMPALLSVQSGMEVVIAQDRQRMLEISSNVTMVRQGLKIAKKYTDDAMQQFISAIKIPHEINRVVAQAMQSAEQTGTKILSLRV